jgi:class 3 adenylate cyclase
MRFAKTLVRDIVAELNQEVQTVSREASVSEAVSKMRDCNIGALPVLDGEQLLGIFTERDVLLRVVDRDLDPKCTAVWEVMTSDPIFVDPRSTVEEALATMTQKRVRHLPVAEKNRLLGLVSSGDLTTALLRAQEHHIDGLGKFVPEVVKRLIAANPEAPDLAKRPLDISVLFVDIVGYTRLSETLTPAALSNLTEGYFSAFFDRIQEAGGDIAETSGDGLMVLFQDETSLRHALKAVQTAAALLTEAERLNEFSQGPPLGLHMGINSGVASVGSTRFEGLRGSRWVYTADGFVPNLAARLAELSRPNQILVGAGTAVHLHGTFRLQELRPRYLRNISQRVELYSVL